MAEHATKSPESANANLVAEPPGTTRPTAESTPATRDSSPNSRRRKWAWVAGLVATAAILAAGVPWVYETMTTVSTDDAYVNGHVTFVAPRVAGQVKQVLVDDNNVVRKGDLLVELDPEPFQVQVEIARAALTVAKADL